MRYRVEADGSLNDPEGRRIDLRRVTDTQLHVAHLAPHIVFIDMPRGDRIGIKVIYSSHCWTERHDAVMHGDVPCLIEEGVRSRVFDPVRFQHSLRLPELLSDLADRFVYFTPTDRNFGVYEARAIVDGRAYTAFFTLAKERGRLNGERHSLTMRVESAYFREQPSKGMRIKIPFAVDAILKGKKIRYR